MNKMLDRIGEYKINKQGIGMTIIEYKSYSDIIIQFDNGEIKRTRMDRFSAGTVCSNSEKHRITKNRIGEISKNKDDIIMQIIAYRSSVDMDIQFEDGTIRKGVEYGAFKRGYVSSPKERVGEQSIASNGMKMTLINYRNSQDIDIQFEDGTIVKHRVYDRFKKGIIKNPTLNIRIGKTGVNKQGYKMKIIEYRGCNDLDVQFEDGTIVKHRDYRSFIEHKIAHPKFAINKLKLSRVGETGIMKCGMKATIIRYGNNRDIDVQFEDGYIAYNIAYHAFLKGKVGHNNKVARIGEEKISNQGLECVITEYKKYDDITVQLEDGTIMHNKVYANFLKGHIAHPKYFKCEHVATFKTEKIFLCACKKCKGKHVLKLSEMKDFECTVV